MVEPVGQVRSLLERLINEQSQVESLVDQQDLRSESLKAQLALAERLKDELASLVQEENETAEVVEEKQRAAIVLETLRECLNTADSEGVTVPSAAWDALALPALRSACAREWGQVEATAPLDNMYGVRGSLRKWTESEQQDQLAAVAKFSKADTDEKITLPTKVGFDSSMDVARFFASYCEYLESLAKVPAQDGQARRTPPPLKDSLKEVELQAIADMVGINVLDLGEEDVEAVLYAGLLGGSLKAVAQGTINEKEETEEANPEEDDVNEPLLSVAKLKDNGNDDTHKQVLEDGDEPRWWDQVWKPLRGYQRLMTDEETFSNSLNAVRLAVFCDTVNGMILQPNYAIMCDPSANKDSFPNTNPFGFSSATYFVPMTALLGMAIAGAVTGTISDKIGRKPVLVFCLAASMVGSMAKYFLRETFWGFCAANFVNGLLSGSLPVALAYIADVFPSNKEKAKQFSIVVGCNVLGQSTGGIIAILMFDVGLFAPLWVGSFIMAVASVIVAIYLVEPNKMSDGTLNVGNVNETEEEAETETPPTEIDKSTLANIVIGAFFDIFGSKALFPLCLSPLAFETYYKDFLDATPPETPIMSLTLYQWLSALVAIMVIPSTIFTPKVFQKFGVAAGCVAGNAITGVLTIVLLLIANIDPPTSGTFAGFVIAMYAGYPFTVMSQLSTSPMLDRITPVDKRGQVQGFYTTVFNTGGAISPWILGVLADQLGTNTAIWIGIGISFVAALINAPLMLKKQYGPAPKPDFRGSMFKRVVPLDLSEELKLVLKADNGEPIPPEKLYAINIDRLKRRMPQLVPAVGSYQQDKLVGLELISKKARDDLSFQRDLSRELLTRSKKDTTLPEFLQLYNKSIARKISAEHAIGQWFAEYLADNGYFMIGSPSLIKIMIMGAFPLLTPDKQLTEENFEAAMLSLRSLYNKYLKLEKKRARELTVAALFKWPIRRFHG